MISSLTYVGLCHGHAPLSVRERVRPDESAQVALLSRLAECAAERFILTTCERFEIYAVSSVSDSIDWIDRLANWFSLPRGVLAKYVRVITGEATAQHLLRVAGGLESRIVGEPQILGQVRGAYQRGLRVGALGPTLAALGRSALRTGKRIRSETMITAGVRSLGVHTVRHIEQSSGSLRERRVLIVGSGNLAADVASTCQHHGAGRLVIAGRDAVRSHALAERFSGRSIAWSDLPDVVKQSDVVIACTSAPTHVIDVGMVANRRTPLLCVDLSVPRNIDPQVATLSHVQLTYLDDIVAERSSVQSGIQAANDIVQDELGRFLRWMKERAVVPEIAAMVARERTCAMPATNPRMRSRMLHERIAALKASVAA